MPTQNFDMVSVMCDKVLIAHSVGGAAELHDSRLISDKPEFSRRVSIPTILIDEHYQKRNGDHEK